MLGPRASVDILAPPLGHPDSAAHCLCKLCVHVQIDRVQVDCPQSYESHEYHEFLVHLICVISIMMKKDSQENA